MIESEYEKARDEAAEDYREGFKHPGFSESSESWVVHDFKAGADWARDWVGPRCFMNAAESLFYQSKCAEQGALLVECEKFIYLFIMGARKNEFKHSDQLKVELITTANSLYAKLQARKKEQGE